jgi:hypothetical protein
MMPRARTHPAFLTTAILAVAASVAALGCGPTATVSGMSSPAADAAPPPDPDAAAPAPDTSPPVDPPDAARAPDVPPAPVDASPADAAPATDGQPAGPAPSTAPGAWARGVQLSLVEVSQAVFIKLGDGNAVTPPEMRNSKLIEGRAAYVRVHVRPEPGFAPRPLRAVLTLAQGDGSQRAIADAKMVAGPSTSENLASTFNFLLPAEAIVPGATLAVAIYADGEASGPEPSAPPRFPGPGGAADLAVQGGLMLMDVVLLPVRGPSGPLDDSPPRRQRLERYMADVYPARKMTIRWHDPVAIDTIIDSSEAFRLMAQARRRDNASAGTYYHLLIAIEDSEDKFLGLGSLAGPAPGEAANRVAMTIVTDHRVDSQMDTVTHEMGHNLGRNHAPGCSAGGTDSRFPYPNTGVGVDGFSLGELASGSDHLPNAPGPFKSKARFKDVMGYCYPTWISDYTWNALMDRIRIVSDYTDLPEMALPGRALQGFYQPGRPPAWAVVSGSPVPDTAVVAPDRFARIERADGSSATVPITVSRLISPAGPEDGRRSIVVNLPDEGELLSSVEVVVDGQRFMVAADELEEL